MPQFDPDDLILRTFLLPPQENGERLTAKGTKKFGEEIEAADGNRICYSPLCSLVNCLFENICIDPTKKWSQLFIINWCRLKYIFVDH